MILDLFPTHIFQRENVLEKDVLQTLYDFIIVNQGGTIVTPNELPELSVLKSKIENAAYELNELYKFKSIEVSNRFSTHYFAPGKEQGMETHSDDLGDFGRKFIAFFYLEAADDGNGELEFFDPRWLNAPWAPISSGYKIKPVTNKLVIFPTFLWHKVNPYFSKVCPRMAIDVVIRMN
jgi:hypothetical protein